MQTVAVLICSYGDRSKWNLYSQRALASVAYQTRPPDHVVRFHGEYLHSARNYAALKLTPENIDWLCFLDCDDQLEYQYLRAMMEPSEETNELRYPAVRYVSEALVDPKYEPEPVILPSRPLWTGNYMVIGTLIRRNVFERVGGFRDLEAYEDWDLWIRAWLSGATPRLVNGAIYRATRRHDGRNNVRGQQDLFQSILQDNGLWAESKLNVSS